MTHHGSRVGASILASRDGACCSRDSAAWRSAPSLLVLRARRGAVGVRWIAVVARDHELESSPGRTGARSAPGRQGDRVRRGPIPSDATAPAETSSTTPESIYRTDARANIRMVRPRLVPQRPPEADTRERGRDRGVRVAGTKRSSLSRAEIERVRTEGHAARALLTGGVCGPGARVRVWCTTAGNRGARDLHASGRRRQGYLGDYSTGAARPSCRTWSAPPRSTTRRAQRGQGGPQESQLW